MDDEAIRLFLRREWEWTVAERGGHASHWFPLKGMRMGNAKAAAALCFPLIPSFYLFLYLIERFSPSRVRIVRRRQLERPTVAESQTPRHAWAGMRRGRIGSRRPLGEVWVFVGMFPQTHVTLPT